MKKIIFLILFILFFSTNVFALEDDFLYKYINIDACLSIGTAQTYNDKDEERSMVGIGFLGNFAFGIQYNRLRYEIA